MTFAFSHTIQCGKSDMVGGLEEAASATAQSPLWIAEGWLDSCAGQGDGQ
jgi:hypothetical protein